MKSVSESSLARSGFIYHVGRLALGPCYIRCNSGFPLHNLASRLPPLHHTMLCCHQSSTMTGRRPQSFLPSLPDSRQPDRVDRVNVLIPEVGGPSSAAGLLILVEPRGISSQGASPTPGLTHCRQNCCSRCVHRTRVVTLCITTRFSPNLKGLSIRSVRETSPKHLAPPPPPRSPSPG